MSLPDSLFLEYFFSYSEQFEYIWVSQTDTYKQINQDQQLSKQNKIILMLNELEKQKEKNNNNKQIILCLQALCINYQDMKIQFDEEGINILFDNQGLDIIANLIIQYIQQLQLFNQGQIQYNNIEILDIEIAFKATLNLFLIQIIFLQQINKKEILSVLQSKQIDDQIQKAIFLSVDLYLVPIRKLSILLFLVLKILLDDNYLEPSNKQIPKANLCENIYTETNFQNIEKGTRRLFLTNILNTEEFYRKNILNVKDNPLAQIIVVGLLRSLLTTCATNNKYNPNIKGVNINREWESSMDHAIEKNLMNLPLTQQQKEMIINYNEYLQNPELLQQNKDGTGKEDLKPVNNFWKNEIDRHRVITSNAISTFFLFLLKKLKSNNLWQSSFLIQLITDANGVLVFLKFLTEKFNLMNKNMDQIYSGQTQKFFDLLQNSVYKIEKLMFLACNNFPDKINAYLLEYNAFFILKKLPQMFELQKINKYSDMLLKIQIPLFNKKMKQNTNNMKTISDLYCKVDEKQQQQKQIQDNIAIKITKEEKFLNQLDKFIKQEKKQKDKQTQQLLILQEVNQDMVRKLHQEYNTYHYWNKEPQGSKQLMANQANIFKQQLYQRMYDEVQLPQNFEKEYQSWLENNVWDYYD